MRPLLLDLATLQQLRVGKSPQRYLKPPQAHRELQAKQTLQHTKPRFGQISEGVPGEDSTCATQSQGYVVGRSVLEPLRLFF